jgi:MFS family permease
MADIAAEPTKSDMKLVISASSLGTIFEWYDFFIWGTLTTTGILGHTFFPPGNDTLNSLLAWATFAVGFGFRPLGAILFGYLGDRLGRKYTFLVTITLMGLATAGIGLVPSFATIGYAAPALILLMRVAQGWRWAANMAARRSMSPNIRRAAVRASTPASSRRAWSAASSSAWRWC